MEGVFSACLACLSACEGVTELFTGGCSRVHGAETRGRLWCRFWGRRPVRSATAVCRVEKIDGREKARCVGSSSLQPRPCASSSLSGRNALSLCVSLFSARRAMASDRHEAFTSYRHLRGAACLHHDGSAEMQREMGCMSEITSVAATIEGVGPERPQKQP